MKCKIERVAVGLSKPSVITLTTEDKAGARGLWDDFRDVDVDVTVKKYRRKRSVGANAYFWELCGKIAFVLGYTKEEIYIEQVKATGLYDTVTVKNEAVDIFTRSWQKNGVGWVCERVGANREVPGMMDIIAVSSFNLASNLSYGSRYFFLILMRSSSMLLASLFNSARSVFASGISDSSMTRFRYRSILALIASYSTS